MKDKYILTDVDGVCLDWEEAFDVWMANQGHTPVKDYKLMYGVHNRFNIEKPVSRHMVRMFNSSAAIGFLPPLRDAQYYIKKLHEKHKYKFIAVTSLSLDPYAQKLRTRNLAKLFGDNTFEEVICLDTGADKDDALLPYLDSGCIWVEDKIKNAELGDRLGLSAVLMKHDHQNDYTNDAIPAVESWKEIYEMLS